MSWLGGRIERISGQLIA